MSVHSEDEGEWMVVPSRSSRSLWSGDPSAQRPQVTSRYHHSTHHPATSGTEEEGHTIHKHKSFEAVSLPKRPSREESEGSVQCVSDSRASRDGVVVSMAMTNQDGSRDEDMRQKIGAPIILSRHRAGLKGSVEERLTGQTGQTRTGDQKISGLSSYAGHHSRWREEEGLSEHESGSTGIRTRQSGRSWGEAGEIEKETETRPMPQSERGSRRGGLLVLHKVRGEGRMEGEKEREGGRREGRRSRREGREGVKIVHLFIH